MHSWIKTTSSFYGFHRLFVCECQDSLKHSCNPGLPCWLLLVSILAPECISTKTKSDKSLSAATYNACLILTRLSVVRIKVDCWWNKTFCGQKSFYFFPPALSSYVKNVFQTHSHRLVFFLFCFFFFFVNLSLINWHRKGELNLWRRALVSLGFSACQRNKTAPQSSNPFQEMGSINQNDSRLRRFINGASSHRVTSVGLEWCLNKIIQNTYTTESTLG